MYVEQNKYVRLEGLHDYSSEKPEGIDERRCKESKIIPCSFKDGFDSRRLHKNESVSTSLINRSFFLGLTVHVLLLEKNNNPSLSKFDII